MKFKIIIIVSIVFLIGLTIFNMMGGSKKSWENWKEERHQFFTNSQNSPFNEAKIEFKGLNYFDYNESFAIKATLSPIRPIEPVKINSTSGEEMTYFKSAKASFEIDNTPFEVILFTLTKDSPDEYHLLFTDETNGVSTYGGGRYIEIPFKSAGKVLIDFNKSYFPYCAYVHDYSCPIPPGSNHLNISVNAGEKE
ncbi:DUF1684 domain-containing protein [Marinigracilibium pacificum]|uniref:DUF1684 domain-containing protein n=1 Tax=Marinigracilibium pacificum TaxID=2729599 RepID=A0A848J1K2_9BACT|nr:DUF1684 domain-containing protein [Marinigracilibium pacificum]NMM49571.1 DUF1684 domain-containing protein [Marinigracilibium pacificum]